ncbi:MAG: hypothetical protein ACK5NG_05755 [Chthoniobacterales bacterium]
MPPATWDSQSMVPLLTGTTAPDSGRKHLAISQLAQTRQRSA